MSETVRMIMWVLVMAVFGSFFCVLSFEIGKAKGWVQGWNEMEKLAKEGYKWREEMINYWHREHDELLVWMTELIAENLKLRKEK